MNDSPKHETNSDEEDPIGGAKELRDPPDPLKGLVEKCASDPGAAFTPEVLERLATRRKEDRAANLSKNAYQRPRG